MIAADPPQSRQWNEAQRLGITVTDRSVLVSAAAGSGKTAVLIERCVRLICGDGDTFAPACDVDELLVVTFTEAAAATMKERLRISLAQRAANGPTAAARRRAQSQRDGIERASIGTLHGTCARILRQFFHLAGLDPNFNILAAEEARLLRRETVHAMLEDWYENDSAGAFRNLVDLYFDGDDTQLAHFILRAHDLLASVPDPQRWLTEARRQAAEAARLPVEQSTLGKEFQALIRQALGQLARQLDQAEAVVRRSGNLPAYVAAAREDREALNGWLAVLQSNNLSSLRGQLAGFTPNRLGSVREGTPGKAESMAAVKAFRDAAKKGPLPQLLAFTPEQLRAGMATAAGATDVFCSLVESFATRYQEAKASQRAVDFGDLERLTLNLLREPAATPDAADRPSAVARLMHRRYKFVHVDEYQDINALQDRILHLLSRECVCTNGLANLFCVGDVKQSIYRFRQADPARFLARFQSLDAHSNANGGRRIDLSTNYRGREPLLGAINTIFTRLMTLAATELEYSAEHHLHFGATFPEPAGSCFAGAPIELHLLPAKRGSASANGAGSEEAEDGGAAGEDASDADDLDRDQREAVFIADRIRQMLGMEPGEPAVRVAATGADGTPGYRNAMATDIVVLLRTRTQKIERYTDALRRAGVPVLADGGTGFFAAAEVRDVLSLLRLLDNAAQDVPLAAVLRSPIGNMPAAADSLARIRLAYPARPGEHAIAFHEAARRYAVDGADELAAWLRDFLAQLERWRELARQRPVAELIWSLYDDTGLLAHAAGLPDGAQREANLLALHRRAAQFGNFQRQGLGRFINFLDDLNDADDLGAATVPTEAADAVRVMTIHQSKGQEFPIVFVADLGKSINQKDESGRVLLSREFGVALPVADAARQVRYPSMATFVVRDRLRRESMAEELRVLYVALTRAKEHLVLVGTAPAGALAKWEQDWADHAGPLPAEEVIGARSMLDWLVPVAIACAAEEPITVVEHGDDALTEMLAARRRPDATDPRQQRLCKLEPLEPPPPPTQLAELVIGRLDYRYPFAAFAQRKAAKSVTELTHGDAHASADFVAGTPGGLAAPALALPMPRFLAGRDAPAATDVGTATHLVMEHLDFAKPDVESHIAGLVDRKLLLPRLAGCVDREAIAWFLTTSLAEHLRRRSRDLLRELPIYFPIDDATAAGPRDRVMVRGRIDLFLPTPGGGVVVDYKTDRVLGGTLTRRADSYHHQVSLYGDAIERITGRRPEAVHLVFLAPREIL